MMSVPTKKKTLAAFIDEQRQEELEPLHWAEQPNLLARPLTRETLEPLSARARLPRCGA